MVKRFTLLASVVLIAVQSTSSIEQNSCTFSLNKQILTCENVNPKSSYIENMIVNTTKLLMLKNTESLKIGPGFHTQPFEDLDTYHITGIKTLEISPFTFQKLVYLKHVKITDNNYKLIANNTFFGLSQLEVLSLNNNSIEVIESGAFNKLTELKTLELTHNNFKLVENYLFSSLKNLDSLFLYHSNIETLEPNSLAGLNSLRVLDLTYNRIKAIDAIMFQLPQLSHLYLSYNRIETIEGDFVCPKLEFFYLQNNKLKVITNTTFNSLEKLIDLDISWNKISYIPEDAFANLKLTNLNYKENNLTSPVNLFFKGPKPFITS